VHVALHSERVVTRPLRSNRSFIPLLGFIIGDRPHDDTMVHYRKFPSSYHSTTNKNGRYIPRAALGSTKRNYRLVVLFGVVAVVSVVMMVSSMLRVADLPKEIFTSSPDPAMGTSLFATAAIRHAPSKSSATTSNTDGGAAAPLLPAAGRRVMERQEGPSVGIFSDDVNLRSAAPSPRRQLQATAMPPSSSSSTATKESTKEETTKDNDHTIINTKAYFIKKGDKFYVTSRDALDLHDHLPPLTYSIGVDAMGELHLQTIDSFELHGKIYGDTKRQSSRILRTFMDRKGSTGVMLAGEQGSGKTFLAKYIAVQEHSVKCRSRLQHRHNSVIVKEDINSLARKLIMIFRNMR
jgi:hypothetical protein